MRKIAAFALLAFLFCCAECSSRQEKMQERLEQMAAKPTATEIESAKALYDESSKFVAWLEAHPEDGTSELLAKARSLRDQRALQIGEVAGGAILEGIKKVIGSISGDGKSVASVGEALDKAIDKVLGVNDPRMKKFGCPDDVDVTQEGASKFCP